MGLSQNFGVPSYSLKLLTNVCNYLEAMAICKNINSKHLWMLECKEYMAEQVKLKEILAKPRRKIYDEATSMMQLELKRQRKTWALYIR